MKCSVGLFTRPADQPRHATCTSIARSNPVRPRGVGPVVAKTDLDTASAARQAGVSPSLASPASRPPAPIHRVWPLRSDDERPGLALDASSWHYTARRLAIPRRPSGQAAQGTFPFARPCGPRGIGRNEPRARSPHRPGGLPRPVCATRGRNSRVAGTKMYPMSFRKSCKGPSATLTLPAIEPLRFGPLGWDAAKPPSQPPRRSSRSPARSGAASVAAGRDSSVGATSRFPGD